MKRFFIIGAQKAGTSALHAYLTQHPQLLLSSKKELHFFDRDTINWEKPSYDQLKVEMSRAVRHSWGEATPIYMYWPNSIERLRDYDPEAKLIVLLRHPVFRAHSHWRMEVFRNAETLSFSDAIREGRKRVKNTENQAHRIFSYVERGLYAEQIRRLLDNFPRHQIHIETTDRLWLEPKSALCAIQTFLGVNEELQVDRKYIISASTDGLSTLSVEDFAYLMDIYTPNILSLEKVAGLSLKSWLAGDYVEAEKH